MVSFRDTGFLKIRLFSPELANAALAEVDRAETDRFMAEASERTWIALTLPDGPATTRHRETIESVRVQVSSESKESC